MTRVVRERLKLAMKGKKNGTKLGIECAREQANEALSDQIAHGNRKWANGKSADRANGARIASLQQLTYLLPLSLYVCVRVCVLRARARLCSIFDISLQLLEIHNLALIPRHFKHIYMQVAQMQVDVR